MTQEILENQYPLNFPSDVKKVPSDSVKLSRYNPPLLSYRQNPNAVLQVKENPCGQLCALAMEQQSKSKIFEKQHEVPKSTAKKVWDGVVTLACFIVLVVGGVGIIGSVVSAILSL